MNTSVLFPPNQEDFSDAIIGSVVQCGEHYHSSNGGRNAGRVSSTSSWFPAAVMKSSWSTAPVPSTHTSDHKRLVSDRRSSDATYSKIQQTTAALVAGDLYAKYMADVEYRRQQNRMHQARYKMRQRKLVADLEDSVNKLKEDIPELEQQHRLLSNKLPSNTSVWGVAAEYFRLFRFGMKGPVSYLTPSRPEDHVQWDFLQTAMAEDVTDGVVLGVQALMDTINYRYRCLDTIDQRPIRMDDGPGNSLTIVIQCDVTITEGMLWYGFPNLVKNEDRSPLADKMLGQKLEIEKSMYLAVDNTTGRVTRLQWKVDLLTPLLRLLGTLNDVSQVFIGARLSAEAPISLVPNSATNHHHDSRSFVTHTSKFEDQIENCITIYDNKRDHEHKYPLSPNREQFSDAVISSLVQRNEHYPSNNIQRTEWRTTKVSRQSYSAALATSALPAVPNACKRLLSDKVCGQITISNERKMRAGVDYSDAKHSADVELRRQRNRMHQARYKMKQRQLVADLEAAVTHLRQEIQELEIQQRLLSYGLPTTTTIWNIAAEYFRLFRHGTKGSTMVENAHIEPALNLLHSQVQWDFMKTTMAPDVTDGVVIGIDALIESHALQSRCYEAIDLQPLRMDDGPEGLLIVSTQCELTITESMLVCGFPNLVKDGEWSSLADKMLGKKIVIYGSTHFFWDNTRGRVVRLQWKADVMTALLRLLGSLDTVPQVFNGARMSPEGMVKPSL